MYLSNMVDLTGRLGRDPESFGKDGVLFSIAVDRYYKDKDGVRQKITDWIKITAYRTGAEIIAKSGMKKGDLVRVLCHIEISDKSKEEDKRVYTNFIMDEFQILHRAGSGNGGDSESSSPRKTTPEPSIPEPVEEETGWF